ncbi:putative ribonuclease H-like domain-containing protein, partial [Tanacetum coccineum]
MELLLKNIDIVFRQSKFYSRDGYVIEGELKEYEDSCEKSSVQVWAMKMEYWITNNDMNIWKVIQNGNNLKRTRRDRDGRVIILPPTTADEHIVVQRESKARTTLLQSIPDDHVADFHYMDDARDIWNAVKARFGGNAEVPKDRKSMLKQEFSEFRHSNTLEGIESREDTLLSVLNSRNQQLFLHCYLTLLHQTLVKSDWGLIGYDRKNGSGMEMDLKWQMANSFLLRYTRFEQKAEGRLIMIRRNSASYQQEGKEIGNKEEVSKALIIECCMTLMIGQSMNGVTSRSASVFLIGMEAYSGIRILCAYRTAQARRGSSSLRDVEYSSPSIPVPTGKPKVLHHFPTGRSNLSLFHVLSTDRGYSPSVTSGLVGKSTARPMPHLNRPAQEHPYSDAEMKEDYWKRGQYQTPTRIMNKSTIVKELQQIQLLTKFFLPDESMVVLRVPRKHNIYTINLNNLSPKDKHKKPPSNAPLRQAEPKDTFGDEVDDSPLDSAKEIFQQELIPSGDTTISPGGVSVPTGSPTDSFFDDEPTTRFPSPSDLGNNEPSPGKYAIGTKWILKNKRDDRGIVVRNKARLVAQGHRQEESIDYDEVFAPITRIEAIRLFLAFASYLGFMVYQMDVKSAFLYSRIDEEVYVTQPKGFVDPQHPKKVYKVVKALYGLHQAPRAWYATLSTFLLKHGYRRGTIDKTFFLKKYKRDIILGEFEMGAMGELTFFLGLQVQQRPDGMFISQD